MFDFFDFYLLNFMFDVSSPEFHLENTGVIVGIRPL